jgi:hypothetical protein
MERDLLIFIICASCVLGIGMFCMLGVSIWYCIYKRLKKNAISYDYIPNSCRHVPVTRISLDSIILSSHGVNYHIEHRGDCCDIYRVELVESGKCSIYVIPWRRLNGNAFHYKGKTFGCLIIDRTQVYNFIDPIIYKLEQYRTEESVIIGASNRYCIVKITHYRIEHRDREQGSGYDSVPVFDHISYSIHDIANKKQQPCVMPDEFEQLDFLDQDLFMIWILQEVKIYKIENMQFKFLDSLPCVKGYDHHVILSNLIHRNHLLETSLTLPSSDFYGALARITLNISPIFKSIPVTYKDTSVLLSN